MRIFILVLAAAGFIGFSCTKSETSKSEIKKVVDEETWGRINRAKKAVKVYTRTGDGFFKEGMYDKAITYYDKALLKLKYLKKLNHPDAADIYVKMGDAYMRLNDKKTALEYYEKALRIYSKFYGKEHFKTKQVMERMEKS
ncbi:tetratricopeptide repeat protein [Persephonella sp.]